MASGSAAEGGGVGFETGLYEVRVCARGLFGARGVGGSGGREGVRARVVIHCLRFGGERMCVGARGSPAKVRYPSLETHSRRRPHVRSSHQSIL